MPNPQSLMPCFILFRPQLGENIGAVARAMSNFGLSDLRIIAPRDGWPNEAAEAMAAHGVDILKRATIHNTLAEALHDITHLYATSARHRAMGKPVLTPREMVDMIKRSPLGGEQMKASSEGTKLESWGVNSDQSRNTPHASSGASNEACSQPLPPKGGAKSAILFGPEASGLSNEELVLADAVITIPVSEQNPSLNLAQAAVVIGYEWFKNSSGNRNEKIPSPLEGGLEWVPDSHNTDTNAPLPTSPLWGEGLPATKAELDGLFTHLKPLLKEINYFRESNKEEQMWLHLRHIFTRTQLTSQEVKTLRGLVRSVEKRIN